VNRSLAVDPGSNPTNDLCRSSNRRAELSGSRADLDGTTRGRNRVVGGLLVGMVISACALGGLGMWSLVTYHVIQVVTDETLPGGWNLFSTVYRVTVVVFAVVGIPMGLLLLMPSWWELSRWRRHRRASAEAMEIGEPTT
jgi:hypothetical protein